MRKNPLPGYFSAVLFSLSISAGAVLCPITTYDLTCNVPLLAAICVLGSFLLPVLYLLPRRKLIWPLFWLVFFAAGYFLRQSVWDGFRYCVLRISTQYSLAYRAFAPLLLGGSMDDFVDTAPFFGMLASLITLTVCWTVLRRQTAFPIGTIFLLVLAICLPDLSCFPGLVPLFSLMGGVLLLLLTQGPRQSGKRGHLLTFYLVLPVALFLGGLFLLFPKEGYERSEWSDTLQSRITNTLAKLPFLAVEDGTLIFSPTDFGTPFDTASVNLQWVGPQVWDDQRVMSVKTTQGGTVYLRGASLGNYTGTTWEPIPTRVYQEAGLDRWYTTPIWETGTRNTITIRTDTVSHVIYTPYFSAPFSPLPEDQEAPGQPYFDAYCRNRGSFSQYTIESVTNRWSPTRPQEECMALLNLMSTYSSTTYDELDIWYEGALFDNSFHPRFRSPSMLDWQTENSGYTAFVEEYYTQLPNSTRAALVEMIRENRLDAAAAGTMPEQAARAFAVADFVRNSAVYDLNTPRMPLGKDFVLWFLEESDTGYCVHFASATVALLRAMNIPARYVTGYTVSTESDQWAPVTMGQAHAWAEFYLPGLGWVPLESTPGDFSSAPPAPTATETYETIPFTVPPSQPAPGTAPTQDSSQATRPTQKPTVPEVTGPEGGRLPGHTTSPNSGPAETDDSQPPWGAILPYLLIVILPPVLLILNRALVLLIRRQILRGLDCNKRAIRQYLHLTKLARAAGAPMPEELTELAKKAKFSRQGLVRTELQALTQFRDSLLPLLRAKPWYTRFYLRWIRVLY